MATDDEIRTETARMCGIVLNDMKLVLGAAEAMSRALTVAFKETFDEKSKARTTFDGLKRDIESARTNARKLIDECEVIAIGEDALHDIHEIKGMVRDLIHNLFGGGR